MPIRILLACLALALAATARAELATTPAQLHDMPRQYRLDGVVEAVNQSTVSAQTQGQVQEVLFDIDDYVEQGALIIRLRDTQQQAELAKAEANLKAARARAQEARDERTRAKSVHAKGLIAQAAMDRADAALQSALANLDAAQAGLGQAREQLEYTRIRAPYSGIVTHRHIETGEIANPGQRLMSGISLEQLRVNVDVPQSLIPAVRKYSQARVELPEGDSVAAARITIFPFAHHGSNTFKVRLDLSGQTRNLFPGMFVKTAFTVGGHRQLLIPEQAVVYRSEVTGAYVVDAEGRVGLRHIRTGERTPDGLLAVLSGLREGERNGWPSIRSPPAPCSRAS